MQCDPNRITLDEEGIRATLSKEAIVVKNALVKERNMAGVWTI